MRKNPLSRPLLLTVLSLSVLLSSCSYSQYSAVAGGASLGGMLGSSIGGIMGGPHGSDKGTLAGMVIGGAVGAAVTAPRSQHPHKSKGKQPTQPKQNTDYDDVYDSDEHYSNEATSTPVLPIYTPSSTASKANGAKLRVSHLRFVTPHPHQRLEAGQKAYIEFELRNQGTRTLYNITPIIRCKSKRIVISAPTTVVSLPAGRGIRYRATVVAVRQVKKKNLQFTISVGKGTRTYTISAHD